MRYTISCSGCKVVIKTAEVPEQEDKGHTTLCLRCWQAGNISSLTPEAQKRYREMQKK